MTHSGAQSHGLRVRQSTRDSSRSPLTEMSYNHSVRQIIFVSLAFTAFLVRPLEYCCPMDNAISEAVPSDIAAFITQGRAALDSGQPGSAAASAPPDALQW